MTLSKLFAGLKAIDLGKSLGPAFEGLTIAGGEITPEMAARWLATSPLNRRISKSLVTAYADSMTRNEWPITNSGVAFNQHEQIIDAHHRMHAIIKCGKAVYMLVFIGLTAEAWDKIDNGRPRSLGERLVMFRPDMKNHVAWASYVTMCAQLTVGQSVLVKTVEDFERWQKLYNDGVTWSLDCFKGHKSYRNATIAGALAFAFPTAPQLVDEFGRALNSTEFKRGTAVWACDRFLRENNKIDSSRAGGTGRIVTVRKVLNYMHAAVEGLEGRKLPNEKALDTDVGVEFFRQAYDTRYAKTLVRTWNVEPSAKKSDSEATPKPSQSRPRRRNDGNAFN